MDAKQRRQEIRRVIEDARQPVNASFLAEHLSVSRQVIVGDVALLRAEGCNIISTARGYLRCVEASAGRYIRKLACRHSLDRTTDELYTIVDLGGQVLDVIVEHALYGEITGRLGIVCRRDVDIFAERVARGESRLLSELTGGIHLHTISCPDEGVFLRISEALDVQGFLYSAE